MGLFGGSKKKSIQTTQVTNVHDTQNLATQDGMVAGEDLRVHYDMLADDVIEDVLEVGADVVSEGLGLGADVVSEGLGLGADVVSEGLELGADVVSEAFEYGTKTNQNAAAIADQAFMFGDEAMERNYDLAALALDKSAEDSENALEVQHYAMQSLASSKGVDPPLFTTNMLIGLGIVGAVVIVSTVNITKIFK